VSSIDAEFEAAWSRFLALRRLTLVSDTLESPSAHGGQEYAAFLISIDDPEARAYLRPLAARLGSLPGVEPYGEDYWHITVKGLGFLADGPGAPDAICRVDLERISESAAAVFRCQPPFTVRLGRVNCFPEAAFVEVLDGLPVREMNIQLLEEVPGLPRQPYDGPGFLPHISIARFVSREALAHLKKALPALRDTVAPGPAFHVRRVDLVAARISVGTPLLSLVRSYDLGG
jgi:2'-5' RNA ligase